MRFRSLTAFWRTGAIGAAGVIAFAVTAPAVRAQNPAPVDIESFTLPNGLTVHMVEDHSSQVVAVNVWYNVGSRNEVEGRTGFAHLFEHMMFSGSAHAADGLHRQLIERAGGLINGSTQPDKTDYYEVIPSNRLNLALWLEADRMRGLRITEENMRVQQEAVKEERRLRIDNQPYTGALVDSLPLMFDRERCFAYAHSMIGSIEDLNAASVDDVKAFFDLYYAPNNATIVLVGDLDRARTRAMITDWFSGIPRGEAPPPVTCEVDRSSGKVVKRVQDPNATLPAVLTAYRTVSPSHADFPALELLSTILGIGESSRLNRSLVRDSKVAVAAQALNNPYGPMRAAGIFGVLAIANQGVSADSLNTQLQREVLASTEAITADELTKAKNSWRSQTIFGRQQALALSEAVQHAAMFLGSPSAVNTDARRYSAVTLADLRRVARTYLQPENSFTLLIVPEGR
ncbi:MAG TPA: pitrilysin family protein [Gemmatimonadaceae bacterium]|nr:pitrilysin family protein [Gemmatimonadaceae bacterium]